MIWIFCNRYHCEQLLVWNFNIFDYTPTFVINNIEDRILITNDRFQKTNVFFFVSEYLHGLKRK